MRTIGESKRSLRDTLDEWAAHVKRRNDSHKYMRGGACITLGPYRPLKYTEVNQWTHWDGTGLSHAKKCG